MPVTIYDVAERAGVAASTVSKYINHGVLRTEVRKRVEEAIQTLNYVPSSIARGLKNLKSFTVGVIIPTLDSTFTAQIISAIEKKITAIRLRRDRVRLRRRPRAGARKARLSQTEIGGRIRAAAQSCYGEGLGGYR